MCERSLRSWDCTRRRGHLSVWQPCCGRTSNDGSESRTRRTSGLTERPALTVCWVLRAVGGEKMNAFSVFLTVAIVAFNLAGCASVAPTNAPLLKTEEFLVPSDDTGIRLYL